MKAVGVFLLGIGLLGPVLQRKFSIKEEVC